jgi:hypothetical protein
MSTHDTMQREIDGAVIRVFIGDDDEPSKRPETLDVHITVSYRGGGASIDPSKVTISGEGESAELHGNLMLSPAAQLGLKYYEDPGYVLVDIQYPAPAGRYDVISVKFAAGAFRLLGQNQDVRPIRFRRVKKHDVFYGSMNC